MSPPTLRQFLGCAVLWMSSAAAGVACRAGEPLAAYQPQLCEGSVVYHDEVGRPFNDADGVASFVPVTSPCYGRLLDDWQRNAPEYREWSTHEGHREGRSQRIAPAPETGSKLAALHRRAP